MNPFARYARWLHTGFPAGTVEPTPIAGPAGETRRAGVRVAGDLLGTPLLKLAVESGARAARAAAEELAAAGAARASTTPGGGADDVVDVAVVGAGPAGLAAAAEARARGLSVRLFDARGPFSTLVDFPAQKPIYLYPTDLDPEADVQVEGETREALLEHLEHERIRVGVDVELRQLSRLEGTDGEFTLHDEAAPFARARKVIVAVGRSGARRRLDVPGEELPHVRHRLHDPRQHAGRRVVVVGGGDSALEAATAIAEEGGFVTLVHRGPDLARAKAENRARVEAFASRLDVSLDARVVAVDPAGVTLDDGRILPADDVLVLVGREPPVALLDRLGLERTGRLALRARFGTAALLAFAAFVYVWKSGGELTHAFERRGLFPFSLGDALAESASPWLRVLSVTLEEPGFHYSLAYTLAVVGFGFRRVARTPTPYVRTQTLVLALVQCVPLFLLPYFVLPYLGQIGAFDSGAGRSFADAFFPAVTYGHGREYWRAFGFVLAFPLFIWNVFTAEPSVPWLVVSVLQTFVLIPWLVREYGKGAYCGFICSCGALAETLGDAQREKMPKGAFANRLNLLGQGVLGLAALLLVLRIVSWMAPRAAAFGVPVSRAFSTLLYDATLFGVRVDYYHVVDVTLAGILGVGLYFAYSGRTWCRFACPLAALMNVYSRAFTRFRIFADAKKCIACNRCTSVCHQGIDVMHFAVRGAPMDDPQCVRCSACVAACPTATLSFGRYDGDAVRLDALEASPVRMREGQRVKLRVVP